MGKSENKRVLSPHLGIYKWEITSVTSALYRITVLMSCLGLLCLVALFFFTTLAVMYSQHAADIMAYKDLLSPLWAILLWAAAYQVLSNIRHILWDFNIGVGIKISRISGYVLLFSSVVGAGFLYWILI